MEANVEAPEPIVRLPAEYVAAPDANVAVMDKYVEAPDENVAVPDTNVGLWITKGLMVMANVGVASGCRAWCGIDMKWLVHWREAMPGITSALTK